MPPVKPIWTGLLAKEAEASVHNGTRRSRRIKTHVKDVPLAVRKGADEMQFADDASADYLAPRQCFREPIAEILEASLLLSEAADAHLAGNRTRADECLRAADMPAVRAWTDSLWGSAKRNPDLPHYIRYRPIPDAPPSLPKADRISVRMPTASEKSLVLARYGRHCAFCGNPLISSQVREEFRGHYPEAAYWGPTATTCHAAFQCMWLQFDHVLPHARGGDNSIENVVPTCAGCNYGRVSMTLEEVGLLDPRTRPPKQAEWDGLERIRRRIRR